MENFRATLDISLRISFMTITCIKVLIYTWKERLLYSSLQIDLYGGKCIILHTTLQLWVWQLGIVFSWLRKTLASDLNLAIPAISTIKSVCSFLLQCCSLCNPIADFHYSIGRVGDKTLGTGLTCFIDKVGDEILRADLIREACKILSNSY